MKSSWKNLPSQESMRACHKVRKFRGYPKYTTTKRSAA